MEKEKDVKKICRYDILRTLGKGTFGSVYRIVDIPYDKALKYIRAEGTNVNPTEVDIQCRLRHPYLASASRLLTSITCPDFKAGDIGFIMDLAVDNLYNLISSPVVNRQVIVRLLYDISTGIEFLHSNSILHLDVKPLNMLVYGDARDPAGWNGRVADFSLSEYVPNVHIGTYIPHTMYTLPWRPPEILQGTYTYDERSDVWALGITFVEALSRTKKIDTVDYRALKANDIMLDFILDVWGTDAEDYLKYLLPSESLDVIHFLMKMLDVNRLTRATMADVLTSVLFQREGYAGLIPGTTVEFDYEPTELSLAQITWLDDLRYLFISTLSRYRVETYFLAVDIYRRVIPYYSDERAHDIEVGAVWIASKMLEPERLSVGGQRHRLTMAELQNIHFTGVSTDDFYLFEELIYEALHGVIYRKALYSLCKNLADVLTALKLFNRKEYFSTKDIKHLPIYARYSEESKDVIISRITEIAWELMVE